MLRSGGSWSLPAEQASYSPNFKVSLTSEIQVRIQRMNDRGNYFPIFTSVHSTSVVCLLSMGRSGWRPDRWKTLAL